MQPEEFMLCQRRRLAEKFSKLVGLQRQRCAFGRELISPDQTGLVGAVGEGYGGHAKNPDVEFVETKKRPEGRLKTSTRDLEIKSLA